MPMKMTMVIRIMVAVRKGESLEVPPSIQHLLHHNKIHPTVEEVINIYFVIYFKILIVFLVLYSWHAYN